jgi:hypothetical protein
MTRVTVHLDRPTVPVVAGLKPKPNGIWEIDLDLTDELADGRGCIWCGQRGEPLVPVGWADRPPAMLERLRESSDARQCQVFAHVVCQDGQHHLAS